MFTGLIDDVGVINSVGTGPAGRELRVRTRYDDLADGESIAINGACLTVLEHGKGWFTVAAVETTLGRTTIGEWQIGRRVNLERALVVGARFGGHMVAGHVDGVATVVAIDQAPDSTLVALAVPPEVMELSVLHGSIAVDGVSLTINGFPPESNRSFKLSRPTLQVSLIQHTLAHTSLGDLRTGGSVHVETDLIGKYVQQLLEPYK